MMNNLGSIKILMEDKRTTKVELMILGKEYRLLTIFREHYGDKKEFKFLITEEEMDLLNSLNVKTVVKPLVKVITKSNKIETLY